MCWLKGDSLPFAIIIFVSLIRTSITCDSFTNAIEGESIQLSFPCPCYSLKITLQYLHGRPFYNSAIPEFLELNPDQSERFTVEDPTKEENHCFLLLSIDPVMRDDEGAYILLADYGLYLSRVRLYVDFLPGIPHCSFGGIHNNTRDLERLHCKATAGSMLGQIQCYQEGMLMPHLGAPSENNKTLKQTILVQQNRHHVYCCSSLLKQPKEMCDCNDAVWDPFSQGEVHNPGDPCPTTNIISNVLQTTSYNHDHTLSTARATKDEIKEENHPMNTLLIVVIVVFGMFMSLFILYIIHLAQSKLMRRRSNATKTLANTACEYVEGVHVKLMNINPDKKINGSIL